MLVSLAHLAHDLLIWTRNDLAANDQAFQRYGILRLVRDVLQIDGCMQLDADGQIRDIVLNDHHPLSAAFHSALITDDLSANLRKI